MKTRALAQLICLIFLPLGADAESGMGKRGLEELSLQDLMEMEVTSAAKKPQKLFDTDAAIHVITQDDIRRSGAASIPEALRLVPGINVSRINGGLWAVSIRGFNGRFANKLQVLMDGRSLYTPLFAGVIWETHDTVLEDIERIEVIRGPGAALWGANAVNGVINIITRKAQDTQDSLVSISAGSEERLSTSLRHGFKTAEDSHARIYGKVYDRDASQAIGGLGGQDGSHQGLAGFRWDKAGSSDNLTLQGQAYRGRLGDTQLVPDTSAPPYHIVDNLSEHVSGAHLLGRWERWLDANSEISVQSYLDHNRIDIPRFREARTTLDLEFQHRLLLAMGHDFTWGLGYRHSRDDIRNSATLILTPAERGLNLFNLFVQDEIALLPDSLRLTLGARIEHNDFTGWEMQPNARLLWRIDENRNAWLAVSRAMRTPAQAETDVAMDIQTLSPADPANPFGMPLRQVLYGTGNYSPEALEALDLGYRARLQPELTLDAAFYVYRYRDLIGAAIGAPDFSNAPAYVLLPLSGINNGTAHLRGLEIALDWQPAPGWRVQPGYSYAQAKVSGAFGDGGLPRRQYSLHLGHEPTRRTQIDLWVRHASDITTQTGTRIPGHTTLDLRLAWRPSKVLELSLVGQNLLDPVHPEYVADYLNSVPAEIQRSVFIKADWRF